MPRRDAAGLLDAYLHEIGRLLPGPARARRDVVDELRDGLLEAAAAHRDGGLAPHVAIRTATARFGTPAEVAAAHAPELTLGQSRRSSWRVLGLLLAAGLTWLAYRHVLGVPASVVPASGPRRETFLIMTSVVQYLPLATALSSGGLLLGTGRLLGPVLPDRCGRMLACTVTAALGAHVGAMSTIMATGGAELWTGSRTVAVALLAGLVGGALVESMRAVRFRFAGPHP